MLFDLITSGQLLIVCELYAQPLDRGPYITGTISNRPIDGEGIPALAAGVARRRIQPAERTAFVYIVIYWFNHISAFLTHPARGWGSEHRRTIDNRPYSRSPYFAD